ncbi:MAG: hypothetical protein Terrestrivirus2_77 [Terrestrivirus sp.]|uniref:Uncharacterized protein n=1 Tax=Terrestrivirus sp. TaxID=2487775 RepID=A0A3G4ZQ42_9VIRU|nr:MAG: hypothetical protein Terrestrivirus2_77 [Terrestrivirus sp.]
MSNNHPKSNNCVPHHDYNYNDNIKYTETDTDTDNDSIGTFRTESTESLSSVSERIHPDIHNYITELQHQVDEIEQIKKTLKLNSDTIYKLDNTKLEYEKKIQKLEYEYENKINKLINKKIKKAL